MNGNPATITSNSPTTLVFTTPPGTQGTLATVVVTTSGGTASTSYAYVPATPVITTVGPPSYCSGGSVLLTSSSPAGNQWYLDGNPLFLATSQSYSARSAGSYTVIATLNGCPALAPRPRA